MNLLFFFGIKGQLQKQKAKHHTHGFFKYEERGTRMRIQDNPMLVCNSMAKLWLSRNPMIVEREIDK